MLETKTEVTPLDAIVLLCGGVHRSPSSKKWGLNFESSFKAKAAAIVYQRGVVEGSAPRIIASGGPMWGAPPLGKLMAEYLSSHRLNDRYYVPREAILEENESTDSGQQVENILRIISENDFRRVGVVADSIHMGVVVPLFHNLGLDVEPLVMEDYLVQVGGEKRSARYRRVIDRLHNSLYWKWWNFKYSRLEKKLEQDPQLSSPRMRAVARFQRTKLPWLRLPGTT